MATTNEVSQGGGVDAAFFRPATLSWDSITFERIIDPVAALKMSDEARFRRAHLAKYVKVVVGLCCILCVAAFVRVALGAASREPPTAGVANAAAGAPPVVQTSHH